jgi:hypothetical protein
MRFLVCSSRRGRRKDKSPENWGRSGTLTKGYMPYYRFSLKVPAEAAVVAERLRGLTGHRHDSWIDRDAGPAFFGKVKDNSFRIRRNIGMHRNSFLPRILGRITTVDAATRVDVTMWMNPLVLGVMLFWFAGVGCGAWASLQTNGQDFPILALMLTFGLCVSLGSFYWEARKARSQLSNGVMNMTVDSPTPAERICAANAGTLGLKKSHRGVILTVMAGLTLIPTALTLYQLRKRLRDCPAFQESLAIVTRSPEAKQALGDQIEIAGFERGFVQDRKEFGYA